MFQRRADQAGLVIKDTIPFLTFDAHDIGDVCLQNDRAAIQRPVFRYLHPATAAHPDVKDDVVVLMPFHPAGRPIKGRLGFRQRQIVRFADQIDVIDELQSGHQRLADVGHVHAETAVAQHQFFVGVE